MENSNQQTAAAHNTINSSRITKFTSKQLKTRTIIRTTNTFAISHRKWLCFERLLLWLQNIKVSQNQMGLSNVMAASRLAPFIYAMYIYFWINTKQNAETQSEPRSYSQKPIAHVLARLSHSHQPAVSCLFSQCAGDAEKAFFCWKMRM